MTTPVRVREDRLRPITLRPSPGERRLRWLVVAAGLLGLAQAAVVVAVAPDASLPVTLTTPPGRIGDPPAVDRLTALPVSAVAAAVLVAPAVADLATASRWALPAFVRALRRRDGSHRRLPAALGGPLLVGAIALRAGISDLAALVALCASGLVAAVAAGRGGAAVEPRSDRRWEGSAPGATLRVLPWIVVAVHLAAAGGPPEPTAGGLALVSLGAALGVGSVVRNSLAHRGVGPWRRYNMGEAVALVTGLATTSMGAWLLVTTTGSS